MTYRFKYKAASADGKIHKGFLDAEDVASVKKSLDLRGLIPIGVHPQKVYGNFLKKIFKPSINPVLIASFAKKLGSLIRAGIPIIRALRIIESEQENPGFKQAIGKIAQSIEGGKTVRYGQDRTGSMNTEWKIFISRS